MKKKIMRRWIAWLMLVIVVLGSLEFPENMLYVKAAESDEVPDYDIWMANTMMYGMENNGNGLYGRTFQNLQIPIYKELGGYLLEDKVQVGLSAFWSVYFNDEYREQFANEQKYLYEVILMDYIKNGLDEEIEVDLQNNYLEFSAELYKTLADYHFDNGISAAEFEISVEEAESILKNYSTAEGIGTAVEAVRDFADTKDKLLEAVSEYLALQRVKEEKIMLLTMAKEACIASDAIQDNDFIQAVDDIISCLQKTQIDYAYGTGRDILIEKAKSLFWKKVWDELGKKFPIFKVLELEAAGLDAIFDTSNSASGNLKLAVLYTTDCYMNMGLLRASSNFRTTASKKNASRFLSCFKGYLEFQMYGNDYAKEWMEEYLNGASMVSTSRWIFSKEQCENVQELITIGNTQKENRSKLFELIDRYAKIYRGMYGLSNPGNGTGERRELKNPIINGDGEATWDCVWFGNYWQEDTNGDGKADKNDEKQPIKWRVLSVDESSVFLLADKGLDCKTYNQSWKNVTWESCTLRSWLNGYGKNSNKDGVDYTSDNFMDQAFSSREQSDILETVVVDKDYPGYGSVVGNNTTDRVYLLSIGEAGSASYGFLTEISSKSSKTRKSKNTAYAEAQQADIDDPIYEFHEKYCEGYWWLRSPCYDFYHMAWAVGGGEAKYNYVHFYNNAVRPVLKLSLASSLWSYAGTVDSDGKVNEIQPREQNHDSSGNNETEGDTIPSGEIGIASFSTETVSEGKKDKELSFSGSLQFSNVTEISKDLLEQKVSSLDWTSNDQSIVSDAEILCMGRVADDNKSINLQISFTPKKAGVVTITGTAPDGKTASCVVTVTNPATDDLCILDFPGIQYYVQGEAILKISNAFMVINQVRCEFYADVTNIGTEPSELFIFDIYYYKPDNDSVDQRVGGILGDIRVGQTTSLTWDSDANFGKNIAMERKWNRFRIVAKDGSNMSTDALPSADTGIAESRVSSIIIDSDVSGRMNEEVSISGEFAIRKKSSESLDESKRILEDEISHLKWKSNNQSIIADKDISCDGNLSSNVTQLSGHILLGYQVKCTPKQCGQVVLTGTNKDGSVTASCKITVTVSLKYRTDGSAWVEKKGDSANIEHSYYYNDDFFYKDSRQYNNSLAVMSLGLELSSFSDPDYEQTEAQYKEYRTDNKRAGNIQDAYEKLGFDSWHFRNYENPLSDDSDKVAYSFAKKEICQGDQHDTLIAVVVRGGGYGAEWVSNFHVGNSGNAIGFDTAAKKILPELKEYIKTLNITGNLKLWITGFSRGGATANILTHYINEDLESVHSSLKNKNIFAYTFATPSGYRKSKNYDRTVDGNLWNIVSANDLVPKLALVQWGFSKYGNTLVFPEYTSGALKKNFYNYTGDELNIKNANDAEEVLTNLLYDVTLGTPGWTLEFEPKVMDGLRAGNTKSYFDKAVFVSEFIQLIDEIMHSKMGTGKLIYALSCWVGEELAYVSSLSWDDPSIAQVLGNIGYAHYPEHYLCWLEGGNSVLLKDNLYAKDGFYASLPQTGRSEIDRTVEDLFSATFKKYHFYCPVDVKVYDKTGDLVVDIVNNQVLVEKLPCYVVGDEKIVYLPDEEKYDIKLIGNDKGSMDYTVQEFNNSSEEVRAVYYYDIPLEKGLTYEDSVEGEILDSGEDYSISDGMHDLVPALDTITTDSSTDKYTITVTNGVSEKTEAMEGENLSVVSIVPEGYEFVKWTSNAGDGIFDDAFAVSTRIRMQGKSLEVEAVVKKIHSNESETMVPEKETSNVSTEPSASPNSTQPSALPSVNTGADSQSASSTASSGGSSSGSGGGSGAGGGQIGGPSKPFASPTSTQTPEASPEKNEDVQTSVSPVPTAQAEEISSVAGTPKVTEPPKTTERPKVTEPPKATEQPTASPANTQMPNKDSVKEQNTILSKGKTFTKGNFKYKVIKSASRDKKPKAGKVKVIGLSKKGKCALKLKLLTEIIYKNQTFKITKLGKGVFKGAKASVISLPKAVKEIPTAAFVNCKKLKILKIGKLKRVAKGAFKGCKKVITVKGSGKKSNLKKLKQSGYRRFK